MHLFEDCICHFFPWKFGHERSSWLSSDDEFTQFCSHYLCDKMFLKAAMLEVRLVANVLCLDNYSFRRQQIEYFSVSALQTS